VGALALYRCSELLGKWTLLFACSNLVWLPNRGWRRDISGDPVR